MSSWFLFVFSIIGLYTTRAQKNFGGTTEGSTHYPSPNDFGKRAARALNPTPIRTLQKTSRLRQQPMNLDQSQPPLPDKSSRPTKDGQTLDGRFGYGHVADTRE